MVHDNSENTEKGNILPAPKGPESEVRDIRSHKCIENEVPGQRSGRSRGGEGLPGRVVPLLSLAVAGSPGPVEEQVQGNVPKLSFNVGMSNRTQ